MPSSRIGLFTLVGLLVPEVARAHLTLMDPPARHPQDELKYGPCGIGSPDMRSTDPTKITTYRPGETISIVFTEIIDHDPAHYRVAFSQFGDTEFEDPTDFDDIDTGYPILLDGIPDADAGSGHVYTVDVTLPNLTCDTCTLQVIQVMHDKPPWGPEGGDDIYYQCADIVLAGDPVVPVSDGGSGGMPSGTGGQSGMLPPSGGAPQVGGSSSTPDPSTGGASPSQAEDDAQPETNTCSWKRPSRPFAEGVPWMLAVLAASRLRRHRGHAPRR